MANELSSEKVKEYGLKAGANVVGIASSKDFDLAPEGYRPADALEGCRSVIVLGIPIPKEALLNEDTTGFIDIRNQINVQANEAAKAVEKRLKTEKHRAKAVGGMSGKMVDGFTRGPISLKHAAELAGLGAIGRNYLLISPEYGTLLWFSAVLTDAELTPDKKMQPICNDCNVCVELCPSKALDNFPPFGKKGCAETMFKMVDGKWRSCAFNAAGSAPTGSANATRKK